MLQTSETKVPGWTAYRNTGFGNRCVIDGSYFDEGGICNFGHEREGTFWTSPQDQAENKTTATKKRS